VTLTRGGITGLGESGSPVRGRAGGHFGRTVGAVAPATAAAPFRLALVATVALSLIAAAFAGRADGASSSWAAYLAPQAACAGADDPTAPRALQRRSIRCLVNWARAQDGRPRLAPSPGLRKAAILKGHGVASCGHFSHTPCNSGVTDAVRASGYRYSAFGENMFVGVSKRVTPRDVVTAWLRSPSHRANMLQPGFRELGLAGVRAGGILGETESIVWIAAFGSPG
jgi:uncharacterized protein YkwD